MIEGRRRGVPRPSQAPSPLSSVRPAAKGTACRGTRYPCAHASSSRLAGKAAQPHVRRPSTARGRQRRKKARRGGAGTSDPLTHHVPRAAFLRPRSRGIRLPPASLRPALPRTPSAFLHPIHLHRLPPHPPPPPRAPPPAGLPPPCHAPLPCRLPPRASTPHPQGLGAGSWLPISGLLTPTPGKLPQRLPKLPRCAGPCAKRALPQPCGATRKSPETFTEEKTEAQRELPFLHSWLEVRVLRSPSQVDWS